MIYSANANAPNAEGVASSGGEGGVTVATGAGGGGDTRVAFFAGLKLSVCWPLGSLRFASILAAASTAFFTCGNRTVS